MKRLVLCWLSLALLLTYLCPLYYRLYVLHLDSHGTYYRMLWLLPVTVTIGYAACRAIYVHRRVGAVIACAVLILCGSFTYASADSSRAENAYHVPQYVIDLADEMVRDVPGVNVYACVPLEMLFYLRQYDADVCLVYGREAVEPAWGYYNETYEAYELAEELDWDQVLELTRDESRGVGVATYFVVPDGRQMDSDPEDHGLELVFESGGYVLYADRVAQAFVREILAGTPYME